jgi:UDP-glucuronate 4-epimerase
MNRFVVTGCAGFIGSHLTSALLGEGAEVVGIDAFTDCYPRAIKELNIAGARGRKGFVFHEADLAADSLEPLFRDTTGVFHLAAEPGVRASWNSFEAYVRNNVLASQRVFDAATRLGLRTVLASSSSVYGDAAVFPVAEDARLEPISPYGVTKLACERLAAVYERRGLHCVVLRYFTVYGPRQRPDMALARLISAVHDGTSFVLTGTGEQSRDFTYVDDAVSATMAAMARAPAGAIYNVAGGHEVSMNDAITLVTEPEGRPTDIRREGAMAGDVQRTAADCSRIHRELDWSSATPFREGLAAQLTTAAASRVARAAILEPARRPENDGDEPDRPTAAPKRRLQLSATSGRGVAVDALE